MPGAEAGESYVAAALGAAEDWSGDDLAAMLRHIFAAPLSAELAATGIEAPDLNPRLTVGAALAGEELAAVAAAKAVAKAALAAPGDLPEEIARVIHVAAILGARRLGAADVTRLSEAAVEREQRLCLTYAWLDDGVRTLLRDRSGG